MLDMKNGRMLIRFCAAFCLPPTLSGDLADLPAYVTMVYVLGANTITGDIKDMPRGMVHFVCAGDNTITGGIEGLPEGLVRFDVSGSSTVSGDIGGSPETIEYLRFRGSSEISYTAGKEWAEEMECVWVEPAEGSGLSTAEVDDLLVDLSGTTWTGIRRIWLAGNNEPRSEASDGAVEKLEGMGVRVDAN